MRAVILIAAVTCVWPSAAQTVPAQSGANRACALLSKADVKKIAGADDQFFDMAVTLRLR